MRSIIIGLSNRFSRDIRANVAILTALCAIPIFGMLGFAMDYGTALSNKSQLDNAADEAALIAVKTTAAIVQGGGSFSSGSAQGISQAQMAFAASAGKLGFANVPTITPTITQVNTNISAKVSYATSMTTNVSKILGISSIPIQGSASAIVSLTTYTSYYVLVDTSGSMGIGATAADMVTVYNATASGTDGGSCVFACHGHYSTSDTSPDYESLAHAAGATLRIDSARSAVQSMITQARNTPGNAGNIKIGLYTICLYCTSGSYLKKVSDPPNSNYTSLSTAANAIDLSLFTNNHTNGPGWTDSDDAIKQLAALIPASGDGLTASTPINYAFIISDGLQDVYCGHNCTAPITVSACQTLQANATVGTIYTTYLPIYDNNNPANDYNYFYKTEVLPVAAQIAPNMKQCASDPSLFFQADDGPALISALQQLFASTNKLLSLSQ